MKSLSLDANLTQAKYDVPNIGTVYLANSLIGYMLADVIILCFNNTSSITEWLQDVEYAFLTLQKPVNKDKILVISCQATTSTQEFNYTKIAINNLIEALCQIGFSEVFKINIGCFGLSSNHIKELLKEKGTPRPLSYGGMVLIPSGVNGDMPDSTLGPEIWIENSFLMSQSQITQKLYKKVTHENPSEFTGEDHPVDKVSWADLLNFSNSLSHRDTCYTDIVVSESYSYSYPWRKEASAYWQEACTGYRLPTEREWEYACRAFSDYKYSGSNNAYHVAWFDDNSDDSTHPVGQLKMNGFGLYDMSGNVWEWCWDEYDSKRDPVAQALRGGAWCDGVNMLRAACRNGNTANSKFSVNGGRLARSIR